MENSSSNHVPILAFHKIDPKFEWGVTRLTPSQFRKVLHYLNEHGYSTISLQSLFNPEFIFPSKPIVLTFDDAYESFYTHTHPIMNEFGYTGTIFIISNYVGKKNDWDVNLGWKTFQHLNWEQILDLKNQGYEFGSHTVHHPNLTRIDDRWMQYELEKSKFDIEEKLNEQIEFISFPFGRYNKKVVQFCLKIGYVKGCGFLRNYREKKESFVIERKAYYLFDRVCNIQPKLGGHPFSWMENIKLRAVNYCSYGSSLVKPPVRPYQL